MAEPIPRTLTCLRNVRADILALVKRESKNWTLILRMLYKITVLNFLDMIYVEHLMLE